MNGPLSYREICKADLEIVQCKYLWEKSKSFQKRAIFNFHKIIVALLCIDGCFLRFPISALSYGHNPLMIKNILETLILANWVQI